MSSEFHVTALVGTRPGADAPSLPVGYDAGGPAFDRVRWTADDRPHTDTLPALVDPAADHPNANGALDPMSRLADVEHKHRRVIALLDELGYDALLLGRVDSVAWFTAGADLVRDLATERSSVLVYVNRGSRAILCDNVQSARVFEEEVAGLGFQLKERPWHNDPDRVVAELTHNKKVATDLPLGPLTREDARIRRLRRVLTRRERQRLRELGRSVTLAVEATCRNFIPGEKEADIAGHLAHRLMREGILPVDLRVASDDRLARYRQPTFKAAPINKQATISVVGRRHGLCAGVTRTVSLGPVDHAYQDRHNLAAMVDATCIFFSRPGETIEGVFRRARRIYEKFDHPDEWMLDYQGCMTGYAPNEGLLLPDSSEVLQEHTALRWSPSVGAARSEDTVVIDARGFEVVTEGQNWPKVEVTVKGYSIARPGILER